MTAEESMHETPEDFARWLLENCDRDQDGGRLTNEVSDGRVKAAQAWATLEVAIQQCRTADALERIAERLEVKQAQRLPGGAL